MFQETYRKEYLSIAKELNKNKIPYITVPHGELGKEAQKKKHLKKMIANILFFNRFTKNAEAIQCLSKREFNNTKFGKKKIIATNGTAIPELQKISFSEKQTRFVYIGRLDAYHKGLDLMIDAIKIQQELLRNNNCSFSIYGPNILGRAEQLQELIDAANIGDIVKQYGPVSGNEKIKVLLESDVFIQTSRFEGMPLGILEAMSYGIPCFVTQGTTLGEEIEKNQAGWMTETNADSIATKLMTCIKEREFFPIYGNNGREYMKENFAWDIIAKKTVDLYEELVN